jgi:DeoR C terminal sensor domain
MGHSTPNPDNAQIKDALIRIADETYVLVDSSKYGHNCLTSFAHLRDVHLTITDNRLSRAKAKTLEAAGAKLRIAEVADEAHLNREPFRRLEPFNSDRNTFRDQPNAYPEKRETPKPRRVLRAAV